METIGSYDDLFPDEGWAVIGLPEQSVVIVSSGAVAQLINASVGIWRFFDPDTGEQFDRVSDLLDADFPLTVVKRYDDAELHKGYTVSETNRFRERALVEFFNVLEGGAPVLGDGAL